MPGPNVWRNWHETVSQPVSHFEVLRNADESQSSLADYNRTTASIQDLIRTGVERNISIRAVGGAWSFTNIAATDGILLATQRLNYRFALPQSQLQQQYGTGELPVFLQCGISIADINRYLDTRGQALPTSGASNGQTIAGALSTGTHGSAVAFGAIQDCVVAVHVATGPDTTVWIERASRPILADDMIARFGATIIRDDSVFNAALVSFGCFGIILGVAIEPVPAYFLHAWRQPIALTSAVWQAIRDLDFAALDLPVSPGSIHHFELLCNVLDNERTLVTVMHRCSTRPPGAGRMPSDSKFGKGDSALDAIGAITAAWDGTTPIAAKLLTNAYKPYANIAGTCAEFFKDTSTRGRGASTAVGVPLRHAEQAFEIACSAVRGANAPAFVSMRFVKATSATLGFTMHEPVTAVTEIDGAYNNPTLRAQKAFWDTIRSDGIPHSFHWGKFNDLDAVRLRMTYSDQRVDDWIAARRMLIEPACRQVFSNAFSDAIGVSA